MADSDKPKRRKRAPVSRSSRIMLAVTGCLALFALWTVLVGNPRVAQPILQPPKIWSSRLALEAEVLARIEGLALTLQRREAAWKASPSALAEARKTVEEGAALLLILAPGSAPTADPGAAAQALLAWSQSEGLQPSAILSVDWPLLEAVIDLAPKLQAAFASREDKLDREAPGKAAWLGGRRLSDVEGSVAALVRAAGGKLWAPTLQELRPEDVADAKALGIAVLVSEVDDPETFLSLLLLRPDALVTARPQALLEAMAERPGLFAVGSALEQDGQGGAGQASPVRCFRSFAAVPGCAGRSRWRRGARAVARAALPRCD